MSHGASARVPAFVVAGAAALALHVAPCPSAGGFECVPCVGDLDGSNGVDGADLGMLLSAWGPCAAPGCQADLDGDGVVDGADLGLLLGGWGECVLFDYPEPIEPEDPEAYQIAMELLGAGGPLLPPTAWVDRVARDMQLIRAVRPSLAGQAHTPAFQWDFLILKRDQSADPAGYDCLNDHFQSEVWAELTLLGLTILRFPGPLNMPALAPIYQATEHVIEASPSAIYGGENFWLPSALGGLDGAWIWFVDDGFHDCFDGCDCHDYYSFSVTGDGVVTVLEEWSEGAPWCPWPK